MNTFRNVHAFFREIMPIFHKSCTTFIKQSRFKRILNEVVGCNNKDECRSKFRLSYFLLCPSNQFPHESLPLYVCKLKLKYQKIIFSKNFKLFDVLNWWWKSWKQLSIKFRNNCKIIVQNLQWRTKNNVVQCRMQMLQWSYNWPFRFSSHAFDFGVLPCGIKNEINAIGTNKVQISWKNFLG